ncbi:hypothetical protein BGZ49_004040 [Haplosporangium sp. Z 27]|nr:hypothetical protein BGZ49_004040 [Haplosporangium sp. Z 27]
MSQNEKFDYFLKVFRDPRNADGEEAAREEDEHSEPGSQREEKVNKQSDDGEHGVDRHGDSSDEEVDDRRANNNGEGSSTANSGAKTSAANNGEGSSTDNNGAGNGAAKHPRRKVPYRGLQFNPDGSNQRDILLAAAFLCRELYPIVHSPDAGTNSIPALGKSVIEFQRIATDLGNQVNSLKAVTGPLLHSLFHRLVQASRALEHFYTIPLEWSEYADVLRKLDDHLADRRTRRIMEKNTYRIDKRNRNNDAIQASMSTYSQQSAIRQRATPIPLPVQIQIPDPTPTPAEVSSQISDNSLETFASEISTTEFTLIPLRYPFRPESRRAADRNLQHFVNSVNTNQDRLSAAVDRLSEKISADKEQTDADKEQTDADKERIDANLANLRMELHQGLNVISNNITQLHYYCRDIHEAIHTSQTFQKTTEERLTKLMREAEDVVGKQGEQNRLMRGMDERLDEMKRGLDDAVEHLRKLRRTSYRQPADFFQIPLHVSNPAPYLYQNPIPYQNPTKTDFDLWIITLVTHD